MAPIRGEQPVRGGASAPDPVRAGSRHPAGRDERFRVRRTSDGRTGKDCGIDNVVRVTFAPRSPPRWSLCQRFARFRHSFSLLSVELPMQVSGESHAHPSPGFPYPADAGVPHDVVRVLPLLLRLVRDRPLMPIVRQELSSPRTRSAGASSPPWRSRSSPACSSAGSATGSALASATRDSSSWHRSPSWGSALAHDYTTFLLFRVAIGAIGASFVIAQYHTSRMFVPTASGPPTPRPPAGGTSAAE